MFIVGHTLVWHNQTPPWAFEGEDGKPLDRETALLARIKEHIDTVVGRYKGRIDGWDVVNEAIDDDGSCDRPGRHGRARRTVARRSSATTTSSRPSACAHAADPDAELYYNDYNEWYPAKIESHLEARHAICKAKGVRIDGLGLQGHWGVDYPTLDEIDHMLTEYRQARREADDHRARHQRSAAGLGSARRWTWKPIRRSKKQLNPYADGLPAAEAAEARGALSPTSSSSSRSTRDKIDRVTFWGVHDGQSWLNDWPVPGRDGYPLLFDRERASRSRRSRR